jgi:hypothetical protein
MNDPHDREYAAAVSYLPEHTVSSGITTYRDGSLHTTYAVGDRIRWLEKGQTLAASWSRCSTRTSTTSSGMCQTRGICTTR